jgi:perosamine synthetase
VSVRAARVVFTETDRAEIAAAVTEILTTGVLTLGPYTKAFESEFAAAHEAIHAVATSSGTAALEIALRALNVAGRDVMLPANTFYATAAAVIGAGARPIFADIDAATFALSPRTVAQALTKDTAAVVLVHVGGLITPDVDEIRKLCEDHGADLVEDAAHAHGASYDGRLAGSFGTAAAFSFYPTKVVTCGEGGMIITASPDLAQEARIYRDQGKGSFGANHHIRHGYAWRMSEQDAATGLVHLRRMTESIAHRRRVAARYDAGLAGIPALRPLGEPPGCRTNFYKYIAMLADDIDRTWFKEQLATKHDVRLSGEVYDLPLHRQPVLEEYSLGQSLPVAEDVCNRHVCLPVHSDMRDDEVDEVLAAVTEVIDGGAHGDEERACASR